MKNRLENGLKIGFENGPFVNLQLMDQKCTRNEPEMDWKWTRNGLEMDHTNGS